MTNYALDFKNINTVNDKHPICRILLNSKEVYYGNVLPHIAFKADSNLDNVLQVFFENKDNKDTLLDIDKKIVKDLNFELEKLVIDGIDLKHLIWESKYVWAGGEIDSCLFFGPKGYWEIKFETPVLKWYLKTDHNKNNNDPTWEEDYNYYQEVCQKLTNIK